MQVLVLGGGAREHAIAWKLLQSERVEKLIMAPGNPAAMAQLAHQYHGKIVESWTDSTKGFEALKSLAKKARSQNIDFVIVGPDNLLADGAVDAFTEVKVPAFGPTRAGAQLEASKIFSKGVMAAAQVPTADFFSATSRREAEDILKKLNWKTKQWVLKADGLALGKGVEICESLDEALRALTRLEQFSQSFIIEERLSGKELSWLAFCDGEECSLFPPARDYKTLTNDPLSPNTGGMGAVCPVPLVSEDLYRRVRERVFLPVLTEMKRRGTLYKGVLYAGLMVDGDQFWVLEFNARFGDPEAQVLLPLMRDDLLEWCAAAVDGKLKSKGDRVPCKDQTAVYIVAAAKGYPALPSSGDEILNLSSWVENHCGFFAGVQRTDNGRWLTSGGRVLGALGMNQSVAGARAEAVKNMQKVSFEGMQIREGIGSEWI